MEMEVVILWWRQSQEILTFCKFFKIDHQLLWDLIKFMIKGIDFKH